MPSIQIALLSMRDQGNQHEGDAADPPRDIGQSGQGTQDQRGPRPDKDQQNEQRRVMKPLSTAATAMPQSPPMTTPNRRVLADFSVMRLSGWVSITAAVAAASSCSDNSCASATEAATATAMRRARDRVCCAAGIMSGDSWIRSSGDL